MKQTLIIFFVFASLSACNSESGNADGSIVGEYKRGTNSVSVSDQKGKIGVSICFADKNCIEPCYIGLISKADRKKFSGWVYPEIGDSISDKISVIISFSKKELDISFPQRNNISFGASCEPEGVYKK